MCKLFPSCGVVHIECVSWNMQYPEMGQDDKGLQQTLQASLHSQDGECLSHLLTQDVQAILHALFARRFFVWQHLCKFVHLQTLSSKLPNTLFANAFQAREILHQVWIDPTMDASWLHGSYAYQAMCSVRELSIAGGQCGS